MNVAERPPAQEAVRDAATTGGAAPAVPHVPAPEARVLVVEADDEVRRAVAEPLRAAGVLVDEAANGLDALKIFQRSRPHIALLDVMTPFVDGFSTCRAMRDLPGGRDACIVLMTDLDDMESLQFGYDAGATDFVTKPINPVVLQHRIKFMLRSVETVDQLRTSERKILHLAHHDALTGLPNRRSLSRYMDRLLRRPPPAANAGALFLVDLDGFKRVNDTFGHTAGDELISEVGRRLAARFHVDSTFDFVASEEPRPMLARLGGDEFVYVDPNVRSTTEAEAVATAILATVGCVFDLRGHEIVLTASVGVALVDDTGGDVDTLVQRADAAMYDAKAHDRNNARFYSRELGDEARARLEMESALRHALPDGELEVYYQPKVDTLSRRVIGAEALLRWNSATLGRVPPDRFIGLAEETGLIVGIGRWVLRNACAEARRWHELSGMRGMRIAVNVAARQFRDPRFLEDLRAVLDETGLDPNALELEITEGTVMNDTKYALDVLAELKAMGVWLALDDFGTGYSSLGYLRRFPFDTLKIDRSFVRDALSDTSAGAITAAVVAMAQKLHLHVVAEGVETEEQLDYLRTLGCDSIQGYFFSRPLPAPELLVWMHGRLEERELAAPRPMPPQGRTSAIPPLYAAPSSPTPNAAE